MRDRKRENREKERKKEAREKEKKEKNRALAAKKSKIIILLSQRKQTALWLTNLILLAQIMSFLSYMHIPKYPYTLYI